MVNLSGLGEQKQAKMNKQTPLLTDPTGRQHALKNEKTVIGRAVGGDIVITSKRVSPEHT